MKQKKQKKPMSDNTKVTLCRWWFVGMIYFMFAFGTSIATSIDPLDLIVALGVAIGICTVFVFHPVVYHMFRVRRRGKLANKSYLNRTVMENVSLSLSEIVRCTFVVVLVFVVYQYINIAFIALLGLADDAIVLGGEPILFAVFFVLIYNLTDRIADAVRNQIDKRKA